MMRSTTAFLASLGAMGVSAWDLPSNVRNFHDGIVSKGQCSNKIKSGFYSTYNGANSMLLPQFPSPVS